MSGSIRQRGKSGDAWELRFEAPADPATGERKTGPSQLPGHEAPGGS